MDCCARADALVLALLVLAAGSAEAGSGRVVRDATLGAGGDAAVGSGFDDNGDFADYLITPDLGETRGANLFHSFAFFDVGAGETATFTGPAAIDHVIARVTGGSASQVDGMLRSTIPSADLWLINPSGVLFGAGAQLDVDGSFHASTADYLALGDAGARFYADPARTSVLSVAPPSAWGFLGGSAGATPSLAVTGSILDDLADGETLSFVSRDGIALDGATLRVKNGRVNLAAVGGAAGELALDTLEAAGFSQLGDVLLANASLVDASGDAPGSVYIRGGRVVVDHSRVLAETHSAVPTSGGFIDVEARDTLDVDGGLVSVSTDSAGDAGAIAITGGAVTFENGPGYDAPVWTPTPIDVGVRAGTTSSGAGGAVRIDATTLLLRNGVGVDTGAVGTKGEGVERGRSGTIEIRAHSIEVLERSSITTGGWESLAEPGSISIDLGDDGRLLVDARWQGNSSYALIHAGNGRTPGTIGIDGGTVEVRNGGSITIACNSCTSKKEDREPGQATIRIDVDDVIVSGGGIVASTSGLGDAGTIEIDAASSVSITGGSVEARTSGAGAGGSISIDADSIGIRGGAINAGSFFGGRAGIIVLSARDSIGLRNEGGEPWRPGVAPVGVFSVTQGGGNGGAVVLHAPQITVTEGAIVATSTLGGGHGGSVTLLGDRIRIENGGFVDTTSSFFELPDGSVLSGGDAGDIALVANESIVVTGRNPRPFPDGTHARSRVASSTITSSAAGAVTLRAPRIRIDDDGAVATGAIAAVRTGDAGAGGAIALRGERVIVRSGGLVDASGFGSGTGGSVEVTARESIEVEGEGSSIVSRTGGAGLGGSVSLAAPRIRVARGASVSARSAPGFGAIGDIFGFLFSDPLIPAQASGNAGSVTLTGNEVIVDGGTVAVDAETADGGAIEIAARDRVHLVAGVIEADVSNGKGGDIAIDPTFVILEDASVIQATALAGHGGNIQITADNFFAFPGSVIDASSRFGLDGLVAIHTPDTTLAGTLATLPSSYLDASSQLAERCSARASGGRAGSFTVRGTGGLPADPDGWLPASLAATLGAGSEGTPLASAAPVASLAPIGRGSCR